MGTGRWRAWRVLIAMILGVSAAGPALGAAPDEKAYPTASEDMEEAKRLTADAERLYAQGKYDQALPLAQRALAVREKALGPDHPDVATSLNDLAELYEAKGDYARAEPLHLRALAIREKALGPFHPQVAATVNNLAELYRAKGDYARTEAFHLRALAILEKAFGPSHPNVARSLNNLALLYKTKGDSARAEPLYLRALAIREKALGPDHTDVAQTLNNLAQLYQSNGDYARAEPLYLRAVAIFEKALGPSHPDVARLLNNLAELYRTEGVPARAEPLQLRAVAIFEKALGPDHPDFATCLANLALVYHDEGDLAHAEPLHVRSLAIREKALGPFHPDVALSLNNLALLYQAKGDPARAEPLLQRALGIWEKALGPDHSIVALYLDNLAALSIVQGRLPRAVSFARRAADIQDRNASAVLATGSEDQKRAYMNKLVNETYADISQHVRHGAADRDAARLALTVILRRKGRVLDAMTDSFAALRRSLDTGDRVVLDRLTSVYARLTALAARGPGRATPEQYQKDLAALGQERQALEADVGRRSAAFRAEQHLVTLPEVQAKIPPGAALVEIARYAPLELPAGHPAYHGVARYVAYVLHPTGEPTFADLGEAAPLEAAISTLVRALGDPDLTHDPKPAARALDRLLMAPIRALLGDTRWVFLSPDGALNLIPFGALVDEQGHYLVESTLFSYVTSGRDLLRFGDDHARPRQAPLILADPAFDDAVVAPGPEATRRDVRSIDMVTRALAPLPSTADEARTIARLFPDARVLLRAQATEEAVKAAHAPRFLHLATHGFFLPEMPVPEVLRDQSPGAAPTAAERSALRERESPLLRSGIALAGFNRRQTGSDAGVLTALEAAGLDLYGTRLVVLSACETGLGQASTGEGVYGMRRALTMAGAESQVMSLWKVDTGRTRELMEAYYRKLEGGAGRSEAMRAVQLAMLASPQTASPNLWAAFIVSGEWRTLDEGARLPEIGKVAPGARGCSCGQAGGELPGHGSWRVVALGVVAGCRRARRRDRTRS
jgi:CHAT domain-containing protein/Tfp pilus assembly protein PilF